MEVEQLLNIFNPDILKYIDLFSLIRLSITSKAWYKVINDRNTWIFLIKRDLLNQKKIRVS